MRAGHPRSAGQPHPHPPARPVEVGRLVPHDGRAARQPDRPRRRRPVARLRVAVADLNAVLGVRLAPLDEEAARLQFVDRHRLGPRHLGLA